MALMKLFKSYSSSNTTDDNYDQRKEDFYDNVRDVGNWLIRYRQAVYRPDKVQAHVEAVYEHPAGGTEKASVLF